MAYSVIWPPALPQIPLSNYSETIGVLVIRTQPDLGPAKQRRRAQRPDTLSLTFNMSTVQCETLRAFVQDTLRGTMRFGFTHPRKLTVVEARIIPQGDGQMYTIGYILPDFYQVNLNMEILP
jgi:hypothetical protein|tara:strand:- start:453 stop:818 length:366 start_codon:yes stop_codon:yes gene_type:complete